MLDATPSATRGSLKQGAAPFVALVLFLLAVTAVGLVLQPARASVPADAGAARPHIALVGDSITDQARTQLTEALAPADVDIHATPGRKIGEQLDTARAAAASSPQHVVINLGSNDALLDEPPEASKAALREMVGLFPPTTCIHLVTVNEWFLAIFPDSVVLRERAETINAEMHRLAAAEGYDIVDWAAVMEDAYRSAPPKALTEDTVHPNAAGKARLAQLYRDGIARGCR